MEKRLDSFPIFSKMTKSRGKYYLLIPARVISSLPSVPLLIYLTRKERRQIEAKSSVVWKTERVQTIRKNCAGKSAFCPFFIILSVS